MRKYIIPFLLLLIPFCAAAQELPLFIGAQDILIESKDSDFNGTSGFDLYILKKNGINSVLLTETTKDPDGIQDNYSYRAQSWNNINGDEIRYLNGKPLKSKYSQYSLIDSTPENHPGFGECFHIFIPNELVYGYPWTRNGTVKIGKGTFINIRSFEKKYADYSGTYKDNPFMFDLVKIKKPEVPVSKKEVPVLTDNYNPDAAAAFLKIAKNLTYSKGPDSIVDDIINSLKEIDPKDTVDVVFAIDATGSMKDDIGELRSKLLPALVDELEEFKNIRIGLLLYRDYVDTWRYKKLPIKFFDFTSNVALFESELNDFTINGHEGGDIPEAVYEALYGSENFYDWNPAAVKRIILIGDAGPHPNPRQLGKYTKKNIESIAQKKGIEIEAIITPDDKSARGR